jgi:hypothetical protein
VQLWEKVLPTSTPRITVGQARVCLRWITMHNRGSFNGLALCGTSSTSEEHPLAASLTKAHGMHLVYKGLFPQGRSIQLTAGRYTPSDDAALPVVALSDPSPCSKGSICLFALLRTPI